MLINAINNVVYTPKDEQDSKKNSITPTIYNIIISYKI